MTCNSRLASAWNVPAPWVPALIFGLGVLLLFPSIWSETSVTGMDEYWLSFRTPMEMLERGDWLTPWVNGEPRLQKPPLLYWAILLNYKLFGINLVSARIWGVLAGAGLAVCACLFSRELFHRSGLLAGLLALATMGIAVEGRRAMLDLPAALFSTMAVLFFLKWQKGRLLLCLLGAAFSLGLSFLTKGPVGFLFFGVGAIACLLILKSEKLVTGYWLHIFAALIPLAAICLPWPLAMRHLWSERLSKILGEELAARQFGHWTPGSPLSAWSGALGLILPWTPLMLAAIWSQFQKQEGTNVREKRFLIIWFVLSALPFFFMRSFERYMLALIPAQIVLAAEWLEEAQSGTRPILLRICVLLLALASLAICLFAWWFRLAPWPVIASLLLTGFTIWLVFRPTHPHWVVFSAAVLFTLVLGGVYPRFGINALPAEFSQDLSRCEVTMFDAPQPSLLSMRLGRSVQKFSPEQSQNAIASRFNSSMIFVEGLHRQEFFKQMQDRQLRLEEKGKFHTFYSRRAWVRFARPDATWEDWNIAFRSRSLEGLKSEFWYYSVALAEPKPRAANPGEGL